MDVVSEWLSEKYGKFGKQAYQNVCIARGVWRLNDDDTGMRWSKASVEVVIAREDDKALSLRIPKDISVLLACQVGVGRGYNRITLRSQSACDPPRQVFI
jgi:hypothetical protein